MTQEYVVYATNDYKDAVTHHCITGGQLYETLYELEPFESDLFDFNRISMFRLECLVQKMKRIELECADYSTIIIWFFPDPKEKFPVPDLTLDQEDYENVEYPDDLQYDGDTWCEHNLQMGWIPFDIVEDNFARLRKALIKVA